MIDTHKPHIKIIAMDATYTYAFIVITSSSNQVYDMILEREPLMRWIGGELIQNCFPDFNAEIRELMISGMDIEDQAEIFTEEEEA
jgi:hypothetical protein